jgi:branched-chain amino acid transport system permease protein
VDSIALHLLNGLSAGLLLFLLSSGLTLIFSLMGVLNFAHASFYMLGAYLAREIAGEVGFWPALVLAPLAVGALGVLFERTVLRPAQRHGHGAEMLLTFGLSHAILEIVQLIWGRSPLAFAPPLALQGPAFTLVQSAREGLTWVPGAAPEAMCRSAEGVAVVCTQFPMTRVFMMAVSLLMLAALALVLACTRLGLVIRAAWTHPEMVQALGHDVPRVFALVFGAGCALAGLAGVIGGITFVTEPGMAAAMGPILFVVVVVGGLGSLWGALAGSMLVGLLQTLPVALDGLPAQVAPLLPYLLLVAMLVLRPHGLLGLRGRG